MSFMFLSSGFKNYPLIAALILLVLTPHPSNIILHKECWFCLEKFEYVKGNVLFLWSGLGGGKQALI
jgi:hypothetical protein